MEYTKKQLAERAKDLKLCKLIVQSLKRLGASKSEIMEIISEKLEGKLWKQELLDELFTSSYEREQREREYQNRQTYSNHGNLANALHFFGFLAMPDAGELKKRYHQLVMKLHPDKGGDTAIFQRFQDHKDLLYRKAGL